MSHDLYVVVIKNTIVYIDGQNLSNLAGESSHKGYSTSESSTPPTLLDGGKTVRVYSHQQSFPHSEGHKSFGRLC